MLVYSTFLSHLCPRLTTLSWTLFSLSLLYHLFTTTSRTALAFSSSYQPSPLTEMTVDKGRNIVIVGGGIQGASVAFQLHQSTFLPPHSTITILECESLASAASGKGGGFMARSWGDGSVTQPLHELAFDMYHDLCGHPQAILDVKSYRKLPVLSVAPGNNNLSREKNTPVANLIPDWLDGSVGRISSLGSGHDTAQVTPKEFVQKMMDFVNTEGVQPGVQVILGKCVGINSIENDGFKTVKGVRYIPSSEGDEETGERLLKADDVIVCAGPWSCLAEDWFEGAVQLPMEGVKSTSIVWKPPIDGNGNAKRVDATALFCGEDHRFGTHLEVYPRPDGTIYICGIGGSDYITTSELKSSAFLTSCPPKPDRVEAAKSAFQTMSNTYATNGELMTVQACMRPCSPDALPYMGKIPGYKGAYINAGHNCWGIAWAPACGKAMAELVLEGNCACLNLSPFDPARFTIEGRKGGRGRKKGSLSVGEQW